MHTLRIRAPCCMLMQRASHTCSLSLSLRLACSVYSERWVGEGLKNARPRGTSDPREREGEIERWRGEREGEKKGGKQSGTLTEHRGEIERMGKRV